MPIIRSLSTQQQPLVYRRNVMVAVLLVVAGPVGPTTATSVYYLYAIYYILFTLLHLVEASCNLGGHCVPEG
jgi:hypothetical protein